MHRFWLMVLPDAFFYADHLTVSARRLLVRLVAALAALVFGLIGLGLVRSENWREVLGGALLAWGVSIVVWAISSYRRHIDIVTTDLRRTAEVDLLHARLNQIAKRLGAPRLILDYQLEHAIGARMERLAHFGGLDEFRLGTHTSEEGYSFWDQDALGH